MTKKKNYQYVRIIFVILFVSLLLLIISVISCTPPVDGLQIAKQKCQSCHSLPQPEELDKHTWEHIVLPRMGAMMNLPWFESERLELYEPGLAKEIVESKKVFLEKTDLTKREWNALSNYFIDQAPKTMPTTSFSSIKNLDNFQILFPPLFFSPPSTSFVSLAPEVHSFAEINKGIWMELNQKWETTNTQNLQEEGLINMIDTKNARVLTSMGSFTPTDLPKGSVRLQKKDSESQFQMIKQLQRPVHNLLFDFDGDGNDEMIISEYGKWTGRLAIWQKSNTGDYIMRKVLSHQSGALKTAVIDLDQDGDMDIIALFGQGQEGFKFYQNNGEFSFVEKQMLTLSPTLGSVGFELFDVDGDQQPEIIFYAGDNADYIPINKNYQGIYIYKITQDYTLSQTDFWSFRGCYKVLPIDLDGKAPIDFVAISFFPDFMKNKPADFLQIIRHGQKEYLKYHSLSEHGRWLVMDENDYDMDGDQDLILGSLTMDVPRRPDLIKHWVSNGLPYIILLNKLKE